MGRKYNQLTIQEYYDYIDRAKKCMDFNVLGLYRSILENERLSLVEQITLRDYAHQKFRRAFDFLQIKDPHTFIQISTLGQTLTQADEDKLWQTVQYNQQKILTDKKIKHRNFGLYAKHNCGDENCAWNGMMIKQGSRLAENNMYFKTDKNRRRSYANSPQAKAHREHDKKMIHEYLCARLANHL